MALRLPGPGEPSGPEKEWLEGAARANGAVIAGRTADEAAGHWADRNPWGTPVLVGTHRPEQQPPGAAFVVLGGLTQALERARVATAGKQVHLMGAAQLLRQALAAGVVRADADRGPGGAGRC